MSAIRHLRIRCLLGTLALTLAGSTALAADTAPAAAGPGTVLITGANSGIGLEFAKEYAAKGWTVIATHRRSDTPPTLAELAARYKTLRIEKLDVTSMDSAKALATKLQGMPIDVLINNAGVYNDRSQCKGDDDKCPGDWTVESFGQLKYSLLD